MSKSKIQSGDQVIVHGNSAGKLYIEEAEFFNNSRVKAILKKMFKSQTYQSLKDKQ